MADLLDIVPDTACEVVRIKGTRIIVHGLRFKAVASIISRFPTVSGLLVGGFSVADFTPKFIAQCGDALGPVIAAGVQRLGDEKYEQFASTALLLEDQVRLFTAIVRLTCPNGFGFFLDELAKLKRVGEEATRIKVRLKKSPSPSQPSSDAASRQTMS